VAEIWADVEVLK